MTDKLEALLSAVAVAKALLSAVAVAKDKREEEFREASGNPDLLMALIHRDSANLVANIGGYAAPLSGTAAREAWINRSMCNDPAFHAKVKCVENLIREYIGNNILATLTQLDRAKEVGR